MVVWNTHVLRSDPRADHTSSPYTCDLGRVGRVSPPPRRARRERRPSGPEETAGCRLPGLAPRPPTLIRLPSRACSGPSSSAPSSQPTFANSCSWELAVRENSALRFETLPYFPPTPASELLVCRGTSGRESRLCKQLAKWTPHLPTPETRGAQRREHCATTT